jgi:hypothetical protein
MQQGGLVFELLSSFLCILCGTGTVVDVWHQGCSGHVALGLVDLYWDCGGCVALGLWWTCGIRAVVGMALGLWWTCGIGTVVDVWHQGCSGHVVPGLWWTCGAGAGFLNVLHCYFSNAANQSYICDCNCVMLAVDCFTEQLT